MGNKSKNAGRGTRDCIFFFFTFSPFICLFICVYACMHVMTRGQVVGAGSLLPPCRSWRLNSGPQDWWQVHLFLGPSLVPRSVLKTGSKFLKPSLLCGRTELEDKSLCSSRGWTGQRTRSASCWAGVAALVCLASWDPCSLLFG